MANQETVCPVCKAYYLYGKDRPEWHCEHVSFVWYKSSGKWHLQVTREAKEILKEREKEN